MTSTTTGLLTADDPNAIIQSAGTSTPDAVPKQESESPKYNYPCEDLLDGAKRREYIATCVPLYEASIQGDWEAAKKILKHHKDLVQYSITENKDTCLHVAAAARSIEFVKKLVGKMTDEDLALQNEQGHTALCLAALAGNYEMATIMVERNEKLLTIRGEGYVTPLYLAALYGKGDLVTYLYNKSQRMIGVDWTDRDKQQLFLKCIEGRVKADIHTIVFEDVALEILDYYNKILPSDDYAWKVLNQLARKPYAFSNIKPPRISRIINSMVSVKESEATQLLRIIWKKIVEKSKTEIDNILRGPLVKQTRNDKIAVTYAFRILFTAAEMGNTKFLVEVIRIYPDLIWKRDDNHRTIFHVAVSHRHESIYNLLYEIGSMKDLITSRLDIYGNDMLHLVGMNAERYQLEDASGAAFQMQRELLWFEEVRAMVPPSCRELKNNNGETPLQVFRRKHKDLASTGEKWMKGTANQSMVVAALITTVVFSVAFTIPGGHDQTSGFPVFIQNGPFIAFVIFDAISLISSSTSIIMFLSILTSRYAQKDFQTSLPKKLMIGLGTLFLSIITMMVAFTVSFFVLYHKKLLPIPIIISVGSIIPVFLYAKLQFPLLVDSYLSTYATTYIFRPKKHILYYQNPRF